MSVWCLSMSSTPRPGTRTPAIYTCATEFTIKASISMFQCLNLYGGMQPPRVPELTWHNTCGIPCILCFPDLRRAGRQI
jgi:hypothetical protein